MQSDPGQGKLVLSLICLSLGYTEMPLFSRFPIVTMTARKVTELVCLASVNTDAHSTQRIEGLIRLGSDRCTSQTTNPRFSSSL